MVVRIIGRVTAVWRVKKSHGLSKSRVDETASPERADNEAVLEPVSLRKHQIVRIQVNAHLVVELEVSINVFQYGCRKLPCTE